jgi:hypothetical protein
MKRGFVCGIFATSESGQGEQIIGWPTIGMRPDVWGIGVDDPDLYRALTVGDVSVVTLAQPCHGLFAAHLVPSFVARVTPSEVRNVFVLCSARKADVCDVDHDFP